MVGSSVSIELGVLGSDEGVYTQWILEDNGRAEIPLSSSNDVVGRLIQKRIRRGASYEFLTFNGWK